jgi:hypothetical protein
MFNADVQWRAAVFNSLARARSAFEAAMSMSGSR